MSDYASQDKAKQKQDRQGHRRHTVVGDEHGTWTYRLWPTHRILVLIMKQSPKQSVEFLKFLYPEGPWLLTAIPVDRAAKLQTVTNTFGPDDDVAHWLKQYGGGTYNFYFSVNKPWGGMSKKASRLEIKEMCFLHVDLDPRPREDVGSEQKRIEELLTDKLPEGVPKPSAVVYSGGGYWGFWRLTDPIGIDRNVEKYEEAKLYNLQLELLFGADSCHNVDRIARLPGTINYPDAKKKSKGRVAALSKVLYTNKETYDISAFTKAPQVQPKRDGFSTGRTVTISENVQRLASLDELPSTVKDFTKVIISMGCDPDDPNRWAEEGRSGVLWYACCELVRQGVDDDTIYSIITDPDWKISESVVDGSNGRPDGYARRQIERAREYAIDPKLADYNNRYAVVQNIGGGRCRIVYEEDVEGNKVMVLQSPSDFRAFYANEFVTIASGNATRQIPAGKWWFEHPMRRSYRSIVFLPGQEVPNDVYNLWRGFAYEALPGNCELYLSHLLHAVSSGSESVCNYLLNWMATAVQKPWEPGHTAIVLRGNQGTGKGTFAKNFAKLFGRHGKQITNKKHLTGAFNAHLRDCVVLFADEAIAANSREDESILKTLITEDTLMVEAKGVDAAIEKSYLHVIMASNAEWVVPAGADDRRFVVLDIQDNHLHDRKYWQLLNNELESGGYQALLHLLATRDISEFNPREKPNTDALQEQKTLSFEPLAKWWYGVLQEGALGGVSLTAELLLPMSFVTWDYNVSVSPHYRVSTHQIHKFLLKTIVDFYTRRQATQREVEDGNIKGQSVHVYTGEEQDTTRPNICKLPDLATLRQQFDATHGGPYDWVAEPEAPEAIPDAF